MQPQRIGALHAFQFNVAFFKETLFSPLLFLIVFNPIVHAVLNRPARGFSLVLGEEQQHQNYEAPKVGSFRRRLHVYVIG